MTNYSLCQIASTSCLLGQPALLSSIDGSETIPLCLKTIAWFLNIFLATIHFLFAMSHFYCTITIILTSHSVIYFIAICCWLMLGRGSKSFDNSLRLYFIIKLYQKFVILFVRCVCLPCDKQHQKRFQFNAVFHVICIFKTSPFRRNRPFELPQYQCTHVCCSFYKYQFL